MTTIRPLRVPIWKSHRAHAIATSIGVVLTAFVGACSAKSERDLTLLHVGKGKDAPVETAKAERRYRWTFWPAVVGAVWASGVGALAFVMAAAKDKESSDPSGLKELLGPMHVFHMMVCSQKKLTGTSDPRFRATLHRVDGEFHEQCIPYVGYGAEDPDKMPGAKRRWRNELGLVGRAIRMGSAGVGTGSQVQVLIADIGATGATQEEINHILVKNYGYDLGTARLMSPGRLSSMVVTIRATNPGPVVAVLYCDSSEPEFFNNEEIRELALSAGIGIASFIKTQYS